MVFFIEQKSLISMQANSTCCFSLGLKCVNIIRNNGSDRASSSSIIWPAQSKGALTCLCCSLNCVFTGWVCSVGNPATLLLHLSVSNKNHKSLTRAAVKRLPSQSVLMKLNLRPTGKAQISIIFHLDPARHSRLLNYFWTLILSSRALVVPVFATWNFAESIIHSHVQVTVGMWNMRGLRPEPWTVFWVGVLFQENAD